MSPQSRSPAGRAGGRAAQAGKTSKPSPGVPSPSAPLGAHLSSIMSANRSDNYLNAHMLNCGLSNPPIAGGKSCRNCELASRFGVAGPGSAGRPFLPVPKSPAKALTAGTKRARFHEAPSPKADTVALGNVPVKVL